MIKTTWRHIEAPMVAPVRKMPAKCFERQAKNMSKEDSQRILGAYIIAHPGEKIDQIALKLGWGVGKALWVFKSLGAEFGYGAFHRSKIENQSTQPRDNPIRV